MQEQLPVWVATGGNMESTVKIAQLGLPIAYAVIGGEPAGFKGLVNLYRRMGKAAGHDESKLKVATHSWGYIADTNEKAIEDYFIPTKNVVDAISKDRAHWQPLTKDQYLNSIGPDGAMFVGDPETVTQKIIKTIETLDLDRFMLHMPIGSLPHADVMRSIELFGTVVAPKVREYFAHKE